MKVSKRINAKIEILSLLFPNETDWELLSRSINTHLLIRKSISNGSRFYHSNNVCPKQTDLIAPSGSIANYLNSVLDEGEEVATDNLAHLGVVHIDGEEINLLKTLQNVDKLEEQIYLNHFDIYRIIRRLKLNKMKSVALVRLLDKAITLTIVTQSPSTTEHKIYELSPEQEIYSVCFQ